MVAIGVGLSIVHHLVAGPWRQYLYVDGDSLVPALLRESFDKGEPWQWVFSTQNFFFPETPFYLLSSLGGPPPVAYSINAVLNVVVLYGLLRLVAGELVRDRPAPFFGPVLAAGSMIALFGAFVLTEVDGSPNRTGIATLYVLATYYYGVTVGGLALLVTTLRIRRTLADGRGGVALWVPLGVAAVIVAALTFSNLLFLLEVLAPLAVALVALVFMARLSWRHLAVIGGAIAAGVLVAFVLRMIFASVFRAGVGGYVALDAIPQSIRNLYLTLVETIAQPFGIVKIVVVVALHLAGAALVVAALYAVPRPALASRIDDPALLVAGFVFVTAVSILVGQVMTGSTTSRYLQLVVILPLLIGLLGIVRGVERLAGPGRRLLRRGVAVAAVAAALAVVVAGALVTPETARTVAQPIPDVDCLDDFVGDSDLNGVGTFWLARPYQIYGAQSGQVLQVGPDFAIQAWMVNLASYDQPRFSYVLLDSTGILPADRIVAQLGEPRQIVECGSFAIYDYQGTAGEDELSERVRDSLAELRATY